MIKQPQVVSYMDEFIQSIGGARVKTIWLTPTQWRQYMDYAKACNNLRYRINDVKPMHYRGRQLLSTESS